MKSLEGDCCDICDVGQKSRTLMKEWMKRLKLEGEIVVDDHVIVCLICNESKLI